MVDIDLLVRGFIPRQIVRSICPGFSQDCFDFALLINFIPRAFN